jgi:hypothetical protein
MVALVDSLVFMMFSFSGELVGLVDGVGARARPDLTPPDLALLIRAGCFDSFAVGREVLLRQAEADRVARKGKPTADVWPLTGVDTSPAAQRRAEEWALLGFAPGEPLIVLAHRLLPFDIEDKHWASPRCISTCLRRRFRQHEWGECLGRRACA